MKINHQHLALLAIGLCIRSPAVPQTNGHTLTVRFGPEAMLTPSQIPLSFRINVDGRGNLAEQVATVEARIRTLPGQQVKVEARLLGLSGPSGEVPATLVSWTATRTKAMDGGQQARCSGGSFKGPSPETFVTNWMDSGTLACQLAFVLTDAGNLPSGSYAGTVELSLRAQ